MEELEELIYQMREEISNLLDILNQSDPSDENYAKIQKAIAQDAKTLAVLEKEKESYYTFDEKTTLEKDKLHFEKSKLDLDERKLKLEEMQERRKPIYTALDIFKEFGKIGLSGLTAAMIIKLIYQAESEELMPSSKVNLATKFLSIPR